MVDYYCRDDDRCAGVLRHKRSAMLARGSGSGRSVRVKALPPVMGMIDETAGRATAKAKCLTLAAATAHAAFRTRSASAAAISERSEMSAASAAVTT